MTVQNREPPLAVRKTTLLLAWQARNVARHDRLLRAVATPSQTSHKTVLEAEVGLLMGPMVPDCTLNATSFFIHFQTLPIGQPMSDCKHKLGPFCVLGHENKRPSSEYCQSCNDYDGKIRGAGDIVHVGLKTIGIDKIVKKVEKVTKKPCGCGERRKVLNNLMPRKSD